MGRSKVPLRNAVPQVRALVDHLLVSGFSPPQVHALLQRLAEDSAERQALCPGASPGDLRISLRVVYERASWLRGQQAPSAEEWVWWEEPDPATARLVLDAVAAYERNLGRRWHPLTKALVAKAKYLAALAPDLPLPATLILAYWWLSWESLPERARRERLDALGLFLGHRPWTSPEAAEYYRWVANGSGVRIELDRGLPILVVAGWRLELEQETAGRG